MTWTTLAVNVSPTVGSCGGGMVAMDDRECTFLSCEGGMVGVNDGDCVSLTAGMCVNESTTVRSERLMVQVGREGGKLCVSAEDVSSTRSRDEFERDGVLGAYLKVQSTCMYVC